MPVVSADPTAGRNTPAASQPADIVILAAGIGSRLRPITDTVPKCLVPVAGRSILERLLTQLTRELAGSPDTRIHVVTGYLADEVRRRVASWPRPIHLIENGEYLTTNNMVSLSLALAHVNAEAAGDLIIANGDCVYDDAIIADIVGNQGSFILVDRTLFNDESMKVAVVDGAVRQMGKRLAQLPGHVVSIDLYRFSSRAKRALVRKVAEILAAGRLNEWTEVAIHEIATEPDVRIETLDVNGRPWMEIDTLEDLREADQKFASPRA